MTRWRLASSFARSSDTVWWGATELARLVAALTGGTFTIEANPAGEPWGAGEVLDLVARGEVECGHTAGSFFVERDPVLSLATFVPFGMDARRHAAWLDGPGATPVAEAWARQGVVAIACMNTGAQTGGWFRAPVRGIADLAGLRIRTAGLPALVLQRLGAHPVSLAAADILPALRAGTLDAADWIGPHDDLAMRFHTVAPFYHHPGVLEPTAQLSLVVGHDAWAALPNAHRCALRCAAATVERALLVRYDTLNPAALTALLRDGVTLCRFPADTVAAMRAASAAVLDDLAEDAAFAQALASYRAFDAAGLSWLRMGELETAAAVSAHIP